MLIRSLFLLYFMIIYTCYDVDLIVVLSLILLWLYASYKNGFMTNVSYGSHHVLIGKLMFNECMT